MKLHFLRHADAVSGSDDAARALSKKGADQCRWLGTFFKHAGLVFDAAYSSPLVRARQTAERVLEICNPEDFRAVILSDALLNDTPSNQFEDWLDSLPGVKNILLVGHAPSLADRARRILRMSHPNTLELPKAGMVSLKTEDRRVGTLKGFITPKLLGK